MLENQLPPIEKIAEAFSVVVSDRINLDHNCAEVLSSDRKKTYTVRWNDDNGYTSDDNATHWQGYAGYPVIAVLLKKGLIPYDEKTALLFKNVNWSEVNKQFKRDYEKALKFVIGTLNFHSQQAEDVYDELNAVYDKLKNLNIQIKKI